MNYPFILYIGILIMLSIQHPLSAKRNFMIVGELIRVNPISNTAVVYIYDHNLFTVQNKNKVTWYIINQDKDIIAQWKINILSDKKNKQYVEGSFLQDIASIHAGLKLAFLKQSNPNLILPDKVSRLETVIDLIYNDKDKTYLILIPKGRFIYGSQIINTNHYTRRSIKTNMPDIIEKQYLYLDHFYMDVHEVTNQQFFSFLKETGVQPHPSWKSNFIPKEPVDKVSYQQAKQYCYWASKRLPTELEWEKAARGKNITLYVTREEIPTYLQNEINTFQEEEQCITKESNRKAPVEISQLRYANAYKTQTNVGLLGMCGNVAEWTSSWFLPYRGNTIPNHLYGRRYKVIRGGSYKQESLWSLPYQRQIGGIPDLTNDYQAGFRCAKNFSHKIHMQK